MRQRRLTPDIVRDLASMLCAEHGELKLWDLTKALRDEGYSVHNTFCLGALAKCGAGGRCGWLYLAGSACRNPACKSAATKSDRVR